MRPLRPLLHARVARSHARLTITPFGMLDGASYLGDAIAGFTPLLAHAEGALEPGVSLEGLARDALIFLSAAVVVTPLSKTLNISPILSFLLLGAALGPHGLNLFANSEADFELGDIGIVFLLFSEGLEVNGERLAELRKFLPLGALQLFVSAALLACTLLLGAPQAIGQLIPEAFDGGIDISNPPEALVLGLAGAISSSAFALPIVKDKGWEERPSGAATSSVLLLQDMAVGPILVLLPLVVGKGVQDPSALLLLLGKVGLAFGALLLLGRTVVRAAFEYVASSGAPDAFAALIAIVTVGMATLFQQLGLTNTAGAFAAGLLLANSNFRAQIAADIVPVYGILLAVFFMTAGAKFDSTLVLQQGPLVATFVAILLVVKFAVLAAATAVCKLPAADAVQVSLLLAGGGEFAFVLLSSGANLDVLPDDFVSLFTAIILIAMGLTPLLAEAAAAAAAAIESRTQTHALGDETDDEGGSNTPLVASDAVIVCGYGPLGQAVYRSLSSSQSPSSSPSPSPSPSSSPSSSPPSSPSSSPPSSPSSSPSSTSPYSPAELTSVSINSAVATQRAAEPDTPTLSPRGVLAFDLDPARVTRGVVRGESVVFGDGANAALLRSQGVTQPRAAFVTHQNPSKCIQTVRCLRESFAHMPIYAYAAVEEDRDELWQSGATSVVFTPDDVAARMAREFLSDPLSREGGEKTEQTEQSTPAAPSQAERWARPLSRAALISASRAASVSERTAARLAQLYSSFDADADGVAEIECITTYLSAGGCTSLNSDGVQRWLAEARKADALAQAEVLSFQGFLRYYLSPDTAAVSLSKLRANGADRALPEAQRLAAADAGIDEARAEQLFDIFASLDTDNDGEIALADAPKLLIAARTRAMTDAEMVQCLADIDADKNGKVDFNEFLRAFRDG